jgi:hypothetical protein
MGFTNRISGIKFVGLLATVVFVVSTLGCISSAPNHNTLSEADYKAICKEIPISELTHNTSKYVGQNVKYKGEVAVETYGYGNDNKVTSTGILLGVNNSSLSLYAFYDNSTGAFVNDYVTIYGEVYGNDTYTHTGDYGLSVTEKLPRINAYYIEIDSPGNLHNSTLYH